MPPKRRQNKSKSVPRTIPAARTSVNYTGRPTVTTNGRTSRVVHREMIGSVSGSTTLAITYYHINPGHATSFPWLSTIASSWEMYTFNKLHYTWEPSCGTTATGTVTLAPDYDVYDHPPETEVDACAYMDSIQSAPWARCTCKLAKDAMFPLGNRKYVDDGDVQVAEDGKTIYVGNLYVLMAGQADTSVYGRLWAEYDVTFSVPQIGAHGASSPYTSYKKLAAQTLTTATPAQLAFDTAIINGLNTSISGGKVTVRDPGIYHLQANMNFYDNAAELFNVEAVFQIDDVSKNSSNRDAQVTNGGWLQLLLDTVVQLGPLSTVNVDAMATGAAGVLSLAANANSISIIRL